jgi:hypothetical protein
VGSAATPKVAAFGVSGGCGDGGAAALRPMRFGLKLKNL